MNNITRGLTDKQRAWIDYYKQGKSATEAAKLAGYKCKDNNSFDSVGNENLQKLGKYIKDRDAVLESPRIASMEEINEFWTETMRNEELDRKDRLKASELRAKAAGMFTERIEMRGQLDTAVTKLDGILKQLKE